MRSRVDVIERFWSFVDRSGDDQCWTWTGGKQGKGYGQFWLSKRSPVGAHRFSWELANGSPVPDERVVLHTCDNPPCVNPAHLRVGTAADNNRDKSQKGRNPGNPTSDRSYLRKVATTEVIALRTQGLTLREIAARLDISPATACRALQRPDASPTAHEGATP